MTAVAIVDFSGTGNTQLMAAAVAECANAIPEITAKVFRITGEQITAAAGKMKPS